MLGEYKVQSVYGYINAIIDTEYEEKYGDLILELAQKANSWVDPKDIQESNCTINTVCQAKSC